MAWERAGTMANLQTYRNAKADPAEWVDVVCTTFQMVDGNVRLLPLPRYDATLYRHGVGEVGRMNYRPKRRPNPLALSPRMVGRLAKEIREAA